MFFLKCLSSVNSLVRKWRGEVLARLRTRPKVRCRHKIFIEALEDRIVPQGTPNEEFVTQVYTDLLHRAADSNGMATWSGDLNAGMSEASVVLGIESSVEYRTDLVEQLYETYLKRPADAGGLNNWVAALGFESVEHVQAGILGSAEFFDDAGGSNQGFLNALYEDVLGRAVDSSGESTWMNALNSGESPANVAYSILTSTEYYNDLVNTYYEDFLHRPAEASGEAGWVAALEHGASNQDIIADITASTEYQTRTPNAPVVTSPTAAVTVTTTTDTITGTAENGSLVQIFSDGTVVGSEQLVGAQTKYSITVPLTSNAANTFDVTATNAFDVQSTQTAVPTITQTATTATVTVTTPSEQLNHEGDSVDLTIAATDSASNTLTYSATGLPAGLSIDSSTGAITGTVTTGDSADSPDTVTVTATDSTGATGTATFTWLVDNSTDPAVTAPADQTSTEGASISGVDATATESNKNPLTYSATGLPAGLSINSTTGAISGTIDAGDGSTTPYTVTVSVTDGLNTGSATFTWTVNSVVDVTAPADQTNTEGDAVTDVAVTATDSKDSTLTYSAKDLPAGLSISPSTGIISGTIGATDATGSPYTVTVSATDGTYTGSSTFTWTLNPVVAITPPADQTNTEGASVTDVTVTASDGKDNTLTYTASDLPAGLSIDTSTGEITGTIGAGDASSSPYTVTVTASDGTYSSSGTFTWTVKAAVVVTPPADQSETQGATVSDVTATATDASDGTLTFTATGLPAGLSINPTTGAMTGTIGDDDATANPYSVTITASDGTYSGSATFTWTVKPIVTVTTPTSQTNDEGDTVSDVAVTATDANSTALRYVASGLPAGLTIDSTTGVIGGTIGSDDAAASPYTVTITASDGTYSGSANFTWTVDGAPAAPTVTTPSSAVTSNATSYTITGTAPSGSLVQAYSDGTVVGSDQLASGETDYTISVPLTASSTNDFTVTAKDNAGATSTAAVVPVITQSTSVVTVTTPAEQLNHESDSVDLPIGATDSSSGTLSYSASGLPAGLSIDSSTGVITGTIDTGDSSSSPYAVTVTATDGTNSGTASFTWLVDSATVPSVTAPADQTNTEGEDVSGVTVTATATNSNPLTYSATGLPAGLTIDPTTGAITGTIEAGDDTSSPDTVTVIASDGLNSGSASFSWTITPVVAVTTVSDRSNVEGDTVSVAITATDSLSNALTYIATGLPSGVSIDSTTGVISGTVAAGSAARSPYSVTVIATDGTYSSTTSFTWTITPAIVVTAPADQTSTEGDDVSGVTVSATDHLSNSLTYSATGLPAGLSIDPTTGTISGMIDNNTTSSTPYTVTATATDGTYSASATFTWTVKSAVVVTPPADQTSTEGDTVSVSVAATDSTSKALSYLATGLPAGLSINVSTGTITGTVEAGDEASSPYTVKVTATDGTYSGSASFTWTVDPVVTVAAPADQSNDEGDTVSGVTVTGTDTKSSTLSYTAEGLPTGLSIDSSTGVISGTIDSGDASSSPYTVTVTANDGTYTGSATFTWTIGASNTPIVTAPSTQENLEGDAVSGVAVTATGSGTLTYSATGLPAGLTINSSTGIISGTVDTGDSADSPYNVTVTVSNGTKSGTASFAWVVTTSSTSNLPYSLTNSDWVTLPSGVRILNITTGTGATAEAGDSITVNYTGYLTDGTVFPGGTGTGFTATLSTSNLIAGWVDGVPGMQVGGERVLDIPSSLAYGSNPPSDSDIPNNAELIFDITLTAVSAG